MDLASGLCHYCTMGLPPEKLFLSIHSNWMPWLKPSVTDRGRQLSQGVFCSAREAVSMILFGRGQIQRLDRTDYMEAAGYLLCGNPLLWASCDGWSLSSVFVWPWRGYVFVYIYNALQHFNIIYRTKGNRRITRVRQSMHFFFTSEILSGLFWRDTSSSGL